MYKEIDMLVKQIMTSEVEYVLSQDTLQSAAALMQKLNVGELPVVVGKDGVGIITDRDIVVRGVAHGLDPKVAKVADAMTEGIIACREDDDVQIAAGVVGTNKIRRLPVMNTDGKMSGVVSLADMAVSMDKAEIGELLMRISK
jgi:CBS domain-containing protein